jgi:hypothetical protein
MPPQEIPAQEYPHREHGTATRQPPHEQTPSNGGGAARFITIGSTQEEVMKIQGPPEHIRGQTWVYGVSELGFKDGRVVRYNNFDGTLKIRVLPSQLRVTSPPEAFTIGSSPDEVLAVQGTPSRMGGNRWLFGFSEVRFKDGRVDGYDNFFGDLKVRLMPEDATTTGKTQRSFTLGSSKSDVLHIQGTPTSIRGNLWYYQMSSILFRNGKVHYVLNSSANLNYVPREELTNSE